MGDVLSDLPAVSNFSTAEALEYASEPQRPYQMWLRRPPPPWQASAEQRAALAHAAMEASLVDQEEKRRQLIMLGGHELVGPPVCLTSFMTSKSNIKLSHRLLRLRDLLLCSLQLHCPLCKP